MIDGTGFFFMWSCYSLQLLYYIGIPTYLLVNTTSSTFKDKIPPINENMMTKYRSMFQKQLFFLLIYKTNLHAKPNKDSMSQNLTFLDWLFWNTKIIQMFCVCVLMCVHVCKVNTKL